MIIVRPVTKNDLEAFIAIAFEAGIGMTSMPKNRDVLKKRVLEAEEAFHREVQKPIHENYLFVLEDLKTGAIGGTCGINARTGLDKPLYFYRQETVQHHSTLIPSPQEVPLMRVVRYFDAPSEICSLYLHPEFRREGLGRLLSLSRFLFVAALPHRFDPIIFAEMRGYVDKTQVSPFWEGIGRHFIDMEFEELMHIRDEESIDIEQALPSYPIYISLLPKEVQESIGKIHPHTQPALNMLIQEGFQLTEEIDVFDGGPKIEVETKEIRAIKNSVIATITEITTHPSDGPHYIISNNRLDFRACYAPLISKILQEISLHAEAAEALQVQVGDSIRYVTPSIEASLQPKGKYHG